MAVVISKNSDVAVLLLDSPPVNAVSPTMAEALMHALQSALADPGVKAIVLGGAGRGFSAGADIVDFDRPDTGGPSMRALMAALDSAAKPVVAALWGFALGGGLEIAMAAHWRVAAPATRIGLPEINLGLLPGAGGTQRLPRLVGVASALKLMTSGAPISAEAALTMGLVDEVAEGDVIKAALRLAATAPVRRTRDRAVAADPDAIRAARDAAAKRRLRIPALAALIDCVEDAASLDFDAAIAAEAERFDLLLASAASSGLRHAFLAERAVARLPGIPAGDAGMLQTAAVIGAGTMGSGIAIALLEAGIAVMLIDLRDDALAAAAAKIRRTIESQVERGRISGEVAQSRMALLSVAGRLDAAATVDLVIEAVFEDLEVKRSVFAELGRIARPDAILATNTSTLDVDAIADAAPGPERVVGLHFFSPANIMRLLEVIRGARTAPAVLGQVMALAKRMGKVGVVSGVCDGFIGNRMFEEYLRQAYLLLEDGALPSQVDDAMEHWGFALGPLRVMDLAGQDIGWSIRKRRSVEQPGKPYSRLPDLICEQGRFGQKTKAGWYLYPDGRKPLHDATIDALVVAHSAAIGLARRPVADREIVERCLLALINEGARLLDEGIAARPLDVDQVWLHGYGMAAERGGPMFQADQMGLPHVLERLVALSAGREGWAFQPAPLIRRLVEEGRDFGSLNQ
jgi:3-hydroxyacyl-CoA dehydrogenase